MKLSGIKEAEAWSTSIVFPVGWHKVKIGSAEEGQSKNGNPQIEMEFENGEGSMRDWLTITTKTMGKVAQLLDAVGIDRDGVDDFNPAGLVGKSLAIFVGEEMDREGKPRKRVQVYADKAPDGATVPADMNGLGESKAEDDSIPF